MTGRRVEVLGADGLPEVRSGDDLASLVVTAVRDLGVRDRDVIVVTSKIVSKAEGRIVPGDDRAEAVDAETVRVVRRSPEATAAGKVLPFHVAPR